MTKGFVKIRVQGREAEVQAPVIITDEPTALLKARLWVKKRSDATRVRQLLYGAKPADGITVSSDEDAGIMRGKAHAHRPVRATSMSSFISLSYGEED